MMNQPLLSSRVAIVYFRTVFRCIFQSFFRIVYDFESKIWNPGPELSIARAYHACASFEMDENWKVYVVGGYSDDDSAAYTVEVSVIDQNNSFVEVGEWTEGLYIITANQSTQNISFSTLQICLFEIV